MSNLGGIFMEEKIVERLLENKEMFSEIEKECILNNRSIIARVYTISMLDTYKTLKDV